MKNQKWNKYISTFLAVIASAAALPFLTEASVLMIEAGAGTAALVIAAAAAFAVSYVLSILVHEGGHCVAGLLSGYSLTSFRVGRTMFLRGEDGFKKKKLHLQGTAGQCIMAPPELKDGKMPVIFYNMGGVLMNLIFAGLSLLLYYAVPSPTLKLVFAVDLMMELMLALTNGVPLRISGVSNDGMNALELSRDPAAGRAFWIQLKANELLARGVRMRDMPEEWFAMPSDGEMEISLCAYLAALRNDLLMDRQEFREALELQDRVIDGDNALLPLHRNLMECDRITASLLLGNNSHARMMTDAEFSRFLISMRNYPSVIRTQYVYELLYTGSREKAENCRARFEKIASGYPYDSVTASEREKMAAADARSER